MSYGTSQSEYWSGSLPFRRQSPSPSPSPPLISSEVSLIKLVTFDENRKIPIDRHDSFTCSNKHVMNPFIFWGNFTYPPEIMTIHLKDIILKIANSKQEAFHFYQYPNTVGSTWINIAFFSFLLRYIQLWFSEKFLVLFFLNILFSLK